MLRIAALLVSVSLQNNPPAQRIIAASNVRLRAEPQTTAQELTRLPIGTVLKQLSASEGTWIHVESAEGKTGWVSADLTLPVTDRDFVTAYKHVIEMRLQNEGLSFSDAADLVEFVQRVTPQVAREAQVEFELFWLRALGRAARQVDSYEPRDPARRDFVTKYDDSLIFSEPAGQWFVNAERYWDLEEKNRETAIGEEIAWDGANAGVPGECEGYIPCTFAVLLMTHGRYLRHYPNGLHAAEALERIDYPLREIVKPNTPYTMDPRENRELRESLSDLSRILERASNTTQKAEILSRLKLIEEIYLR
jgi:hypothetical protein